MFVPQRSLDSLRSLEMTEGSLEMTGRDVTDDNRLAQDGNVTKIPY